jgi:hypothetical protein
MKAETYLLTKYSKMSNGLTERLERRVIDLPVDTEQFNKKLLLWQQDLKSGEWFEIKKITLGKRYYRVDAAE